MAATKTCAAGKRAVCTLLECFLVVQCEWSLVTCVHAIEPRFGRISLHDAVGSELQHPLQEVQCVLRSSLIMECQGLVVTLQNLDYMIN